MLIGCVVGHVVATQKHDRLEGTKLLLVQLQDPAGAPQDKTVLAFDSVDAGVGDRVLVVQEGKSAMRILDKGRAAVDAVIVGVVDEVALTE